MELSLIIITIFSIFPGKSSSSSAEKRQINQRVKLIKANRMRSICFKDYNPNLKKYDLYSANLTFCSFTYVWQLEKGKKKRQMISRSAAAWIGHLNKYVENTPRLLSDLIWTLKVFIEKGILSGKEQEDLLSSLSLKRKSSKKG